MVYFIWMAKTEGTILGLVSYRKYLEFMKSHVEGTVEKENKKEMQYKVSNWSTLSAETFGS